MTTSINDTSAGTPAGPGAVRLNTATVTQYLTSQSSLADSLRGAGKRRAVLLRSTTQWDGPTEPAWGDGLRARIAAAPSPLAVHELVLGHLVDQTPGPAVLVVLTDREQTELDPAILARAHKQRIEIVDSWDVVREAFGAAQLDPRLKDANWAAEALLDATPPGGWPALAGGLLSRRGALTALALRRLRVGRFDEDRATTGAPANDRLDMHLLLHWSLAAGGPERLLELRGPERAGLISFLSEDDQAGLAGRGLLALVQAEHGAEAAAFGLVCAALWQHAEADAETYRARGRAEQWFGEKPPAAGEQLDALISAFGRACEEYVAAQLVAGRSSLDDTDTAREARRITGTVLDRAAILARQFGAERATEASPLLAAGMEARFTTVGRTLATGDVTRIAASVQALREHALAADPHARARIERARMAQRLTQWLAGDPSTASDTVAGAIERHVTDIAWVDRALEHIEAGGDPDPVLKAAYDSLGAQVRERRRGIDRSFASTLATWTAAGTDPGSMLTVETFLRRVVEPVVKGSAGRRVLLLILDGLSAAIATELADELRHSWAEYDPVPAKDTDHRPRRRAMAAALPTLTAVSRTSLFAGVLMKGDQSDEKRLFPGHRFWGGEPAIVFHKDDLRADTPGDTFGPALTEALADDRTHVAVVLNTIDDRLAKEQKLGDGTWRIDEIGKLRDLLRMAALQGMAVLITSDHGHVVDRHGVKVEAADPGSARHRLPGGHIADTEIELTGSRVVWPQAGASIVALWDADSRYTALKAGYHGGAALAEFTIPVLAFLPFGAEPPKGWRELGDQRPAWWSLAGDAALAGAAPVATPGNDAHKKPSRPSKAQAQSTKEPAGVDALFDVLPTAAAAETVNDAAVTSTPVAPASGNGLLAALLASAVFEAQLELLARKPPKDKVANAVQALLDAGGTLPATALAQRIGYPVSRADGFAAVLRQLLNFDGIQVLETLPDGRTLRLSKQLLREQFELP
ncbi:hypothetical protein ABIA35_009104 [Catenulispora sp. MAP12-49]|uniref:BREX-2 system phosphatase PglZ n=1 Tax=Catenulispora sp. MAP12-49 TaxID=3156302 RepID=UPI0035197792